jgi:ABC-2 type transport system permease protein
VTSSSITAVWVIAALTLRRVARGRTLWVSALVAAPPIAFAAFVESGQTASQIFSFELLVLSVLPALLVAAQLGEEIEHRTATYLWSRPVPRWTIVVGKLVALVPVTCALAMASWAAATTVASVPAPVASFAALAATAAAFSIMAATLAVLVPRYAMALTICYMLFFDLPLGLMPAALRHLSVTHHGRVLAGLSAWPDGATGAAIGIAAIGVAWGAVALWRIRRLEL